MSGCSSCGGAKSKWRRRHRPPVNLPLPLLLRSEQALLCWGCRDGVGRGFNLRSGPTHCRISGVPVIELAAQASAGRRPCPRGLLKSDGTYRSLFGAFEGIPWPKRALFAALNARWPSVPGCGCHRRLKNLYLRLVAQGDN